jgi:ParB-like chromosome segregation protein Spo0J
MAPRTVTQPELLHWPIDRLVEYARNPRRNDQAVAPIAAAIREYGFRVPILAQSDGLVVDGHLRLKAARQLGLATVPVLLCDDMTPTQIKAFRISVNRMADLAEWDTELLALEIEDLRLDGFDLDLTGFDTAALDALLGEQKGGDMTPPESSTKEIDPDGYEMGHRCPRCGFEFDAEA